MKILFYNHTGKVSGAERVLLMILSKLERNRFEPVVLCPSDGPLIQMVKNLDTRVLSIEPLAARFTWRVDRLIQYFISFVRVIRATRAAVVGEAPDVVHANSIRGGLVMSAATLGLGAPVIWHAHDMLPRHLLSTAIRLFACSSARNYVVVVSHAVAKSFSGIVLRWFSGRVPVSTIHNAVDLDRFYPHAESRQDIRRALGIAEREFLIGTVGQLTARKGQRELIQAFAEVARENTNAVLVIVGEALFNRDAEYAESLRLTAESLGVAERVHFLGPREDIPVIMRALDLLVVNSHAEPFGLTVVEAMASGTPVLATAVDGVTEIIRHGESGWLVCDHDHDALVATIISLIQNPNLRQVLSDNGLREVRMRFSTDRFIDEMQSLYRDMLTSGKTPRHGLAGNFKTELSAD